MLEAILSISLFFNITLLVALGVASHACNFLIKTKKKLIVDLVRARHELLMEKIKMRPHKYSTNKNVIEVDFSK